MQEQNLQRRHSRSRVSNKIDSARKKIRGIRHEISAPFRRTQRINPETAPFCFANQTDPTARLSDNSPSPSRPLSQSTIPPLVMDGPTDKLFGRSSQKSQGPTNVSAIFVHAGAGFHSTTNEHIHLGACNEYVFHLYPNQNNPY